MKTQQEIETEIAALERLKSTLPKRSKFGTENHKIIDGQIAVLREKHTSKRIELDWYEDESAEEYEDGDNDEYHEVMRAYDWMMGRREDAPSTEV